MTRKNRKILCLFLSVISFLNANAKKDIVIDKNLNRRLVKYKRRNKQFSKSKNGNILLEAGLFVSVLTIGGITYLVKSVYGGSQKKIKLLSDKEKSNQYEKIDKKENIVEEYEKINLSSDDEKFISDNFFMIKYSGNTCWNDAFSQFFICPHILDKYKKGEYKNLESEKIRNLLDWIIEKRKEKFDGYCLFKKIEIPMNIRPIYDGYDLSKIKNCGGLSVNSGISAFYRKYNSKGLREMGIINILSFKESNYYGENTTYCCYLDSTALTMFFDKLGYGSNSDNYILTIKTEGFLSNTGNMHFTSSEVDNILSGAREKNYYPTYILFEGGAVPHDYSYYVIYDKTKKIKYLLKTDGLEDSMKVVSKRQFVEKMSNPKETIAQITVIYSRGDIVEKYYVP